MIKRLFIIRDNVRGDTIIEVMISMAILALVIGTSYTVASHSLQTGTASTQRNQALTLAQSQVEYITNAQFSGDTALAQYTNNPDTPFCINEVSGVTTRLAVSGSSPCNDYDSRGYSVSVVYNQLLKVFTVSINWDGANLAAEKSNLKIYYKLPIASQLPPAVKTGKPDVSGTNVTLKGRVNPNGSLVDKCEFELGLGSVTDPYTSTDTIPCASNPGNGASYVDVLAGYTAELGNKYHYRLCASNSVGRNCGKPVEFNSACVPPCIVCTNPPARYITGPNDDKNTLQIILTVWTSPDFYDRNIARADSLDAAYSGFNSAVPPRDAMKLRLSSLRRGDGANIGSKGSYNPPTGADIVTTDLTFNYKDTVHDTKPTHNIGTQSELIGEYTYTAPHPKVPIQFVQDGVWQGTSKGKPLQGECVPFDNNNIYISGSANQYSDTSSHIGIGRGVGRETCAIFVLNYHLGDGAIYNNWIDDPARLLADNGGGRLNFQFRAGDYSFGSAPGDFVDNDFTLNAVYLGNQLLPIKALWNPGVGHVVPLDLRKATPKCPPYTYQFDDQGWGTYLITSPPIGSGITPDNW